MQLTALGCDDMDNELDNELTDNEIEKTDLNHEEILKQTIKQLQQRISLQKTTFFRIGMLLKKIKLHLDHSFYVHNDICYTKNEYFQLCEDLFDIRKRNVYNYIALYERFADKPEFDSFKSTQLIEMLRLTDDQIAASDIAHTDKASVVRDKVNRILELSEMALQTEAKVLIADTNDLPEQMPGQMSIDVYQEDHQDQQQQEVIPTQQYDSEISVREVITRNRYIDSAKQKAKIPISTFKLELERAISNKKQEILVFPKNMKLYGHLEMLENILDEVDGLERDVLFQLEALKY